MVAGSPEPFGSAGVAAPPLAVGSAVGSHRLADRLERGRLLVASSPSGENPHFVHGSAIPASVSLPHSGQVRTHGVWSVGSGSIALTDSPAAVRDPDELRARGDPLGAAAVAADVLDRPDLLAAARRRPG